MLVNLLSRSRNSSSFSDLPHLVLLSFTCPAIVIAIPTIPVYLYLPSFYGVDLGLGLATTGLILMGARIFDTLTDPVIGVLCDRLKWTKGKRKPWVAMGSIVAAVGLYKIFNPPEGIGGNYLFLWSIVLYSGWTMVVIPYLIWGAELTNDYDLRTKITSCREGFGLLGIISVSVFIGIAANSEWSIAKIMTMVSWIGIGLGCLTFPFLLIIVPDNNSGNAYLDKYRQKLNFKSKFVFKNKIFLRLICAWFINGLANGIPASLFLVYLKYVLGASSSQIPQFILLYFIAAICSIPIWLFLSNMLNKHTVWCLAMIIACAAFMTVPFLPDKAYMSFAVICILTGGALGADLVLPPAIQADVVDYDRLKFSVNRGGQQFAFWNMATKLALAVSVGLALPMVEFLGFEVTSPSETGKLFVTLIYAWLPVVFKILSVSIMWYFPLDRKKQGIIQKRLLRRQYTKT